MKHSVGTPRKRRTWYRDLPNRDPSRDASTYTPSKHAAAKRKPKARKAGKH